MPDSIEDVTHLAPSALNQPLRELGADSIVSFDDVLTHGPCYLDSKEHKEARLQHWTNIISSVFDGDAASDYLPELKNGLLTVEQLVSKIENSTAPKRFVVWTTPSWRDRLFCWFAFYALNEADIEANQIATAEPRIPREEAHSEPYVPLRFLEPVELQTGFDDIFYPEAIYVEAGARLWKTFVTGSPRQFAISIGHTLKFFPELEQLAECYGALFPSAKGEDETSIELSRFDQALLRGLSTDQDKTANEAFNADFITDFAHLSEVFVVYRLLRWRDIGVIESKLNESKSNDPFERYRYLLTEKGTEYIEEGIQPDEKTPTLWIGGSRVYTSTKPWVRVIEGEDWWFERFDTEKD